MRRMISAWVALVGLLAITGTASAASWSGSIQGGASIPSGDFGSSDKVDASAGWLLGGSLDYHWTQEWAFGVDGSYGSNTSGAEGSVIDLGGGNTESIDKDSFKTWSAGGHAKYFFPTASTMPVKWYGLVGAGLYGFTNDVTTTTTLSGTPTTVDFTGTDKRAGLKLGLGGVWWANPKVGIHGGVDYNMAFFDKDKSPYSSLQYIGAHLGVTFDIPSSGSKD